MKNIGTVKRTYYGRIYNRIKRGFLILKSNKQNQFNRIPTMTSCKMCPGFGRLGAMAFPKTVSIESGCRARFPW